MSNEKKFILCPRCELNYIEESEGYCKVCKASMGLIDDDILIPDDDEMSDEKLCPVCKTNYISDDEDMCFECRREREERERAESAEDNWEDDETEETSGRRRRDSFVRTRRRGKGRGRG